MVHSSDVCRILRYLLVDVYGDRTAAVRDHALRLRLIRDQKLL